MSENRSRRHNLAGCSLQPSQLFPSAHKVSGKVFDEGYYASALYFAATRDVQRGRVAEMVAAGRGGVLAPPVLLYGCSVQVARSGVR